MDWDISVPYVGTRLYWWGAMHRDELVKRSDNDSPVPNLYVTHDYYSPTAITNAAGTVLERYAYSAFGIRRIMDEDFVPRATSAYEIDVAFQGQFRDSESGFYNYGYRYYLPEVGRWLNRDPIGEEGSYNLYQFCRNDPANQLDYLGLKTLKFALGFDRTFLQAESSYVQRFSGDIQKIINRCIKKAKPRRSFPIIGTLKPPCCPNVDLAEAESLALDVVVGQHFHDKGARGAVWGDPLTQNGPYNSADDAMEGNLISALRSANPGYFGVLLTKSEIYKMPTPQSPGNRALAHASTGGRRFLINVTAANEWTFPHEFGHVMGWTSDEGQVHDLNDPKNLMSPSAGPDPDCKYCELLLSHAQ